MREKGKVGAGKLRKGSEGKGGAKGERRGKCWREGGNVEGGNGSLV